MAMGGNFAAASPDTTYTEEALARAELAVNVATTLNRDSTTLRHVIVSGGPDGPIHVWLSADGYLMKVEVPQISLRAERLPT